ncbi:hypothetical protein IEQ34_011422 [Dendrobium chrysotoxum]|uniref:Uncharacterized protein n=1 Tax=Dendrobium chrysotoxum TaxID=161865 RepID=A0AAV7GSF0_DENCH|nr:hypothetical protein IEQ34_011422 [Dendrobium chrysotoxum]
MLAIIIVLIAIAMGCCDWLRRQLLSVRSMLNRDHNINLTQTEPEVEGHEGEATQECTICLSPFDGKDELSMSCTERSLHRSQSQQPIALAMTMRTMIMAKIMPTNIKFCKSSKSEEREPNSRPLKPTKRERKKAAIKAPRNQTTTARNRDSNRNRGAQVEELNSQADREPSSQQAGNRTARKGNRENREDAQELRVETNLLGGYDVADQDPMVFQRPEFVGVLSLLSRVPTRGSLLATIGYLIQRDLILYSIEFIRGVVPPGTRNQVSLRHVAPQPGVVHPKNFICGGVMIIALAVDFSAIQEGLNQTRITVCWKE